MKPDATLKRMVVPNRKVALGWQGYVYSSRVEMVDDQGFAVAAPYGGTTPLDVVAGETVDVYLTDSLTPLRFAGEVIARRMASVPLLVFGWPEDYQMEQRRRYARVPVRVSVMLVFPAIGEDQPAECFQGSTRDLGGGGIRAHLTVEHSHAMAVGRQAAIALNIPDGGEPLRVGGTVVRVQPAEPPAVTVEMAVEFLLIRETDRNRLYRFIYNRQIELRKKDLL